jgi:hypothetical protein
LFECGVIFCVICVFVCFVCHWIKPICSLIK